MKKQVLQFYFFTAFAILSCCYNTKAQIACNPGELIFDQTISYDDATVQMNNTFDFPVCPGWDITSAQITVMARGNLDGDSGQDERWLIGTEFTANAFSIGNTGM